MRNLKILVLIVPTISCIGANAWGAEPETEIKDRVRLMAQRVTRNDDTITVALVLIADKPTTVFFGESVFRFRFLSGNRRFQGIRENSFVSLPYDPQKAVDLSTGEIVRTDRGGIRREVLVGIPSLVVDDKGNVARLNPEQVDTLRLEFRGMSSFWDGKKVFKKHGLWEGTIRINVPFPAKDDKGGRQ